MSGAPYGLHVEADPDPTLTHPESSVDPKQTLGRFSPGSAAHVSIAHASLVIEPRNWKAWLLAQVVQINWSNVILLISVLFMTSGLKSQMDTAQQQVQSANDAILQLRETTNEAQRVFTQLDANRALLADFNTTLQWAVNEGLPDLARLQRGTRVTVPLQSQPRVGDSWTVPYQY